MPSRLLVGPTAMPTGPRRQCLHGEHALKRHVQELGDSKRNRYAYIDASGHGLDERVARDRQGACDGLPTPPIFACSMRRSTRTLASSLLTATRFRRDLTVFVENHQAAGGGGDRCGRWSRGRRTCGVTCWWWAWAGLDQAGACHGRIRRGCRRGGSAGQIEVQEPVLEPT